MMKYIKPVLFVIAMVVLDRITKVLVVEHLPYKEYHPILGDIFGLCHIKNDGMGFGLLQGKQILFLVFTVIILCILIAYYVKCVKAGENLGLRISLLAIVAGALGNTIDRLGLWNQNPNPSTGVADTFLHGMVTDFFYVKVINFPVFNVADICVTVGAFALILFVIFGSKDEEKKGSEAAS